MKKMLLTLLLLPVFAQGQIITTVAGCGVGEDSLATKAELFGPMSVAKDHSGNAYIVDQYSYRLRKVDASGVITTFAGNGTYGYSGDGGSALSAEIGDIFSVAVDKAGNVYIADVGYSVIRKINTSGIISTIAGTGTSGYNGDGIAATAAELHGASDIAVDTAGNVYIADRTNYRVRKINTSGIITTVAGNGTAGSSSGFGGAATVAEIGVPFRIALDKKGNLYIATYSDWYILKVDTAGILTAIAGTGIFGYSGDGGPATAATFSAPCGLTVDTAGNVYFSDISYSRVREINSATGIINTIAGTGTGGNIGDGGPATDAQISSPEGLTMDSLGNLYITDLDNNRIREMSTGGTMTTFAGQNGIFGEGYNALNAEISEPDNAAVDAAGNVYIPDYYNNRIRKINTVTGIITTVAGAGIAGYSDGYSGDGGPADSAHIYNPTAVAVDAHDNIYIVDEGNERIRKVNTAGIITTIAGNGTAGYVGDGLPAASSEVNYPSGIAIDTAGNIYIADYGNYRVRKINTLGIINTVAGNGTGGYSGDGSLATAAELYPIDVAVDVYGNLYIADGNNRIRKVDTTGIITTIAGTGVAGFSGDGGPATTAEINNPGGVKADIAGNVWFSDYSNRIRMIDTAGIIHTIAGNGTAGYSGDGGPATAAEINGPAGVAVDAGGNLYIADAGNYRIRKVTGILEVPSVNKAAWNVSVYPNPATTALNISASINISDISITNILGQTVAAPRPSPNEREVQVDVSGLPGGIYFVKVNGTMTRKFVKE